MKAATRASRVTERTAHEGVEDDLTFLPKNLTRQCRSLIESYHDVHGFASLPNMLWKFRLGPLIERHSELRRHTSRNIHAFDRASRTFRLFFCYVNDRVCRSKIYAPTR